MASPTDQVDSTIRVVTPENIAFEYRVAGPFRRLPAYLLDLVFVLMALAAIIIFLAFAVGLFSEGLFSFLTSVLWFFLTWFYGGFCETFMNGQTLGKRICGLRVLTYDGRPINGVQAVMRNLLRGMDILIMPLNVFLPLVGLAVMMMNRRFQRLGDLVCGTIVVVEDKQWLTGVAKLPDPRAIQLAAYLPTNFVVSRSLARALSTYVERRQFFSQPRRLEVAKHLGEPLLRKFGLPLDTSCDLLLCSLYYRTFIGDRGDDEKQLALAAEEMRSKQPAAWFPSGYGGYPSQPQPPVYGAPYPVAPPGGYPYGPVPYGPAAYGYGPPAAPPLPQENMAGPGGRR